MPNFRQRDATDCGAACLAFVFNHYRLNVSLADLRRRAGTNQRGTTALGLVEAAEAAGFSAKGLRCPIDDLPNTPLPAIAHLQLERGKHYVVIVKIRKGGFTVMDPVSGRTEYWAREKFESTWTGVVIILAPTAQFIPGTQTKSAIRRVCELLLPRREMLLQSFVAIILSTILSLSTTIFVQKIVDNVLADGNRNLLSLMGVAMLVVVLFRLLLGYYQGVLMLRTAQQIDASIILGYYRHLVRLPQAFFDTMRVGEVTSRVADAVKIRNFLNSTFLTLLLNPIILIFSLGAMFFYSWKLALLSLFLIPLNAALFLASSWLNRGCQRKIMERGADFDAQLVESLNAMSLVRAFRLEDRMVLRSESSLVRLLRTVWTASRLGLAVNTMTGAVNQSYMVALLWIGTNEVMHAQLTAGQLMSCYTLAGYFTGPLIALIGINANIQEALIATDRLYEIIDLECEKDFGVADLEKRAGCEIRIDGVTFAHNGRMPILNDLSITIPEGKISVLTGESGCGKSTLLSLIQRLYEPQRGKIYINGIDLTELRLVALRREIAVVSQNTVLISGTVLENLAPSDAVPDMVKLTRLCRTVGIMRFIESLPQGFRTLLTENGENLSGGQRQRIAIVRALYKDAQILLMDEPTSALDEESRRIILDAIEWLRGSGKTVVIASHDSEVREIGDLVIDLSKGDCSATSEAIAENDGYRKKINTIWPKGH